jgi:hypothetical protein
MLGNMMGFSPLRPFFDVSNFSMNFRDRTLASKDLKLVPAFNGFQ